MHSPSRTYNSIVLLALICPYFVSAVEQQQPHGAAGSGSVEMTSAEVSPCELLQSGRASEEQLLLCHLYESSALLSQLGTLVNEGIDRLAIIQGLVTVNSNTEGREKRKHEYLRFGKRKHEYLRFGKRKHEYLRFG